MLSPHCCQCRTGERLSWYDVSIHDPSLLAGTVEIALTVAFCSACPKKCKTSTAGSLNLAPLYPRIGSTPECALGAAATTPLGSRARPLGHGREDPAYKLEDKCSHAANHKIRVGLTQVPMNSAHRDWTRIDERNPMGRRRHPPDDCSARACTIHLKMLDIRVRRTRTLDHPDCC